MAYFSHEQMRADEALKRGVKQFNDNPRRKFTWQEISQMVARPNIPAIAKEPPKKDHVLSLWFSWGTYEKGKLKKLDTKQSESFLVWFLKAIVDCNQATTATSVSGITFTANDNATTNKFAADAPSSSAAYGIVVGRSGIAVVISNFTLSQRILNGVTSGLLQHGAMSWGSVIVTAPNATIAGARTLTNNALSGPLDVREAGIITQTFNTTGSGYLCVIRDTTSQTILSGQTNTAQYTLKVTA